MLTPAVKAPNLFLECQPYRREALVTGHWWAPQSMRSLLIVETGGLANGLQEFVLRLLFLWINYNLGLSMDVESNPNKYYLHNSPYRLAYSSNDTLNVVSVS